MLSHVGS